MDAQGGDWAQHEPKTRHTASLGPRRPNLPAQVRSAGHRWRARGRPRGSSSVGQPEDDTRHNLDDLDEDRDNNKNNNRRLTRSTTPDGRGGISTEDEAWRDRQQHWHCREAGGERRRADGRVDGDAVATSWTGGDGGGGKWGLVVAGGAGCLIDRGRDDSIGGGSLAG